jgi:hypothetical protein
VAANHAYGFPESKHPFSGLGPRAIVLSVISVAISAKRGPMDELRLYMRMRSGSMPIWVNIF